MRRTIGYLFAATIVVASGIAATPVLAQTGPGTAPPSGQPSGPQPRGGGYQVQANCPSGSHWVDAPGYVKGKWREGHCEARYQ